MTPCELNLSISAVACAIARGKSQQELSLLSAFFTQLGDSLATIAVANDCATESDSGNSNVNSALI